MRSTNRPALRPQPTERRPPYAAGRASTPTRGSVPRGAESAHHADDRIRLAPKQSSSDCSATRRSCAPGMPDERYATQAIASSTVPAGNPSKLIVASANAAPGTDTTHAATASPVAQPIVRRLIRLPPRPWSRSGRSPGSPSAALRRRPRRAECLGRRLGRRGLALELELGSARADREHVPFAANLVNVLERDLTEQACLVLAAPATTDLGRAETADACGGAAGGETTSAETIVAPDSSRACAPSMMLSSCFDIRRPFDVSRDPIERCAMSMVSASA
jgi:hypothetical protein